MAASLQALSNGRFILGYGAGWLEPEYRGYGYEFPSAAERIAQMEEGIRVIRTLWSAGAGRRSRASGTASSDAFCEPRPDPPPPILIAGEGERYLLRVVARHADWWLSYGHRPEVLRRKMAVLADHCRDVGPRPGHDPEGDAAHDLPRPGSGRRATVGGRRPSSGERRPSPVTRRSCATASLELGELGFDQVQLRFAGMFGTSDIELFVGPRCCPTSDERGEARHRRPRRARRDRWTGGSRWSPAPVAASGGRSRSGSRRTGHGSRSRRVTGSSLAATLAEIGAAGSAGTGRRPRGPRHRLEQARGGHRRRRTSGPSTSS